VVVGTCPDLGAARSIVLTNQAVADRPAFSGFGVEVDSWPEDNMSGTRER